MAAYCSSRKICHNCYKKDAYTMGGRWLCAECAAKQAEWKHNNVDPIKRNERRRELRQIRIANHECAECGHKLPEDYNFKICAHCRAKKKNNSHKNNPNMFTRGQYGICWSCNKRPVKEGKRLCEICYERQIAILKNIKHDNKNHIWRGMSYGENARTKTN